MRCIVTILLFLTTHLATAQVDSFALKQAMSNLDKALVSKDEKSLGQLLNADVSYGHSNGWVQTKNDIINDLRSGRLVYNKIESSSVTIAAITNSWATVRTSTSAEGSVNGTAFQLNLHILQVWMKTKDGWQLFARQSTKL